MQRIYSENPPPFHMYNLTKLEVCSEPSQIPKVDLYAIAVFNGFKSLTVSQKPPPQMIDRALNTHLQNVVHNEYHVYEEVSFSFTYAAFAFWSWPCFNEFFKF